MTFTFNDEYLLKSMMSMVRDESSRIVSLGLATHDELRDFIDPTLYEVIKQANGDNEVVMGALTNFHHNLNAVRLPGDFKKISSSIQEQTLEIMGMDLPSTGLTDNLSAAEPVAGDEPNPLLEKVLAAWVALYGSLDGEIKRNAAISTMNTLVEELKDGNMRKLELAPARARDVRKLLLNGPSATDAGAFAIMVRELAGQVMDSNTDDGEIKAICSVLEHVAYELGKKGNHEAAYLVERTMSKITHN